MLAHTFMNAPVGWRNRFSVVVIIAALIPGPSVAQSPEEVGATIGSFLRSSYLLEQATSECAEFGIQPHDSNSDVREVMASRWAAAFKAEGLAAIRKEATKSVQNVRSITAGKSKDFYCGFLIGSASQGHLLRASNWRRLNATHGTKQ